MQSIGKIATYFADGFVVVKNTVLIFGSEIGGAFTSIRCARLNYFARGAKYPGFSWRII